MEFRSNFVAYVAQQDLTSTLAWLNKMKEAKVNPNVMTINTVLELLCKQNQMARVMQNLDETDQF